MEDRKTNKRGGGMMRLECKRKINNGIDNECFNIFMYVFACMHKCGPGTTV